ncbi:hypothetical protein [Rubrivivax albus]|uniref:Uncharacterized protein n=1 Tax=Rubrivivax albus TaxID=2499835 RepID=A0A437JKD2_9BURK|nr:hypothetical protein [Rubrivivax albus]RVT47004.1 hypothetical protein ENE75_24470 [Rubrivivax albus]
MPEFRTRPLHREVLIEELSAFCGIFAEAGITGASLSFGWDSELEIEEMWQPYEAPLKSITERVEQAEQDGIVRIGAADIFIHVGSVQLLLCHEGDLHLTGEGPVVAKLVARWHEQGLEPVQVENSSFVWPVTPGEGGRSEA